MENIKQNISNNLILLRKSHKLTQQEFAKIFNYTDKAVSRWERGESLPDIDVLTQICEYYGVEFEWLIKENEEPAPKSTKSMPAKFWYKIAVILLFAVSVYTIATVTFVYFQIMQGIILYQLFIWAIPVSCLGAYLYCRKWCTKSITFTLLSITLWSLLLSIFLQLLPYNVWPIFIVGIPVQILLILLLIINKMKK